MQESGSMSEGVCVRVSARVCVGCVRVDVHPHSVPGNTGDHALPFWFNYGEVRMWGHLKARTNHCLYF